MIKVTKQPHTLTVQRGDQVFVLPIAEAAALLADVLAALGADGSPWAQGYQCGLTDGKIEGYGLRDREYLAQIDQAQRQQERAERLALLEYITGDVRAA